MHDAPSVGWSKANRLIDTNARTYKMNDALSKKLSHMSPALYVLTLLAASFVIVVPYALFQTAMPELRPGPGSISMQSLGLVGRILLACVVAPLVETALFQWLPVRVLRGIFQVAWPYVMAVSAGLFAAAHTYTVGYVIFAFLVGLVMAYCFAVRYEHNHRSFSITSFVHSLRNGVGILFS